MDWQGGRSSRKFGELVLFTVLRSPQLLHRKGLFRLLRFGCMGSLLGLFSRRQYRPHNIADQPVLALGERAIFVLLANGEDRHRAFLAKVFARHRHGEVAYDVALAISGLVAMPLQVP